MISSVEAIAHSEGAMNSFKRDSWKDLISPIQNRLIMYGNSFSCNTLTSRYAPSYGVLITQPFEQQPMCVNDRCIGEPNSFCNLEESQFTA
jgi:hypothetical protein